MDWLSEGKQRLLDGDLERAVESFRQVLSTTPNCGEACSHLGQAYRLLGRHEEAVEALRQAIEINPDDADARYNMGRAYLSLGMIYKALAQQWALRRLAPDLANDLLNLLIRSQH